MAIFPSSLLLNTQIFKNLHVNVRVVFLHFFGFNERAVFYE